MMPSTHLASLYSMIRRTTDLQWDEHSPEVRRLCGGALGPFGAMGT